MMFEESTEESSESSIRSLKESEAQTTEVTLEAIWLKLAETKARCVGGGGARGCEQGSDSDGVSQQSAQVEVQAQQSAAVPALEEKKRELASEVSTLKTGRRASAMLNWRSS
ncbi:hypothetical protein PF005_g437 [Phytophthora fragariae]|uniref:Uncharacterized protein n=1 Tax=Phytophthora fragariae TaxID=53985 RepID=A0A6A3ZL83_9STRA|nr:hypothetical protein PF007_g441 [Phytophthora fragariae]KAE9237958.1 hypothetical protein PF005_g437 [Phytophthora fragariae]